MTTPSAIIEQLAVHLSGWAELVSGDVSYYSEVAKNARTAPLNPVEHQLLTLLGDGELDLASIAIAMQCSSREVLTLVTQLELQGYVAQTSAGLRAVRHL